MKDDDAADKSKASAEDTPPPEEFFDDDPEGEEATVLARVPDAFLLDMKPKASASGRSATPDVESDALFDALFDEATASPKPTAAKAPARPPLKAPPPMSVAEEAPEQVEPVEEQAAAAAEDEEPIADALAETVAAHSEEPAAVSEGAAPEGAPPAAVSVPSRVPPPMAFEREQDAAAVLLAAQQREAWVARAEWLRAEAEAVEDQAARGRALLAVSELYVMAGEDAAAKAAAEEAQRLTSSPLSFRQVRGILAREGSFAGVLDVLDAETRAATTPAAKCHGSLLGSEIARLLVADAEGAKKRVESALRLTPGDPRAHVQRIAEALAAPEEEGAPAPVSRIKLPDQPELAPLAEALHLILAHRGLTSATAIGKHAPSKQQKPAGSVYEALLRVRASAAANDHAGAITGLDALGKVGPSLAGGTGWLAGALAAVRRETRPHSVEAFQSVVNGSHGALARRALAARAIELGDAAAARAATESAGSEAFSAADRVTISSLTGGAREEIEPWLPDLLADTDVGPIAAAAAAVAGGPGYPIGSIRSRASTTLGRALADNDPVGIRDATFAFAAAAPDHGLAKALTLELDVESGAGGRVSRALSGWREDSEIERERALAAALVGEAAGELDRARACYEQVRAADPRSEAATRAAAAQLDPGSAAKIYAEHAQALEEGSRAAVLLTEAAVRLAGTGDEAAGDTLLRRAAQLDPALPFAHHLGERGARARGEREALIEWVRTRREASQDPIEQAHDAVREALLVSEDDPSTAPPLLEMALRARPSDVALREIYERLAAEPPADRAHWRAARALEATGLEAARLALEAALELERAGDLEGAATCARQAIAAGEDLLAPLVAYRLALGGQGADELIEALLPKARESADPVERLEIYERLAELDERGRGDAVNGLLRRRTILEETPDHLPTLRRVASMLISAGRDDELGPVALEIARSLDGPESVAHAMLSARLRQKASSWDDTREAVEVAYKHTPRGLWVLRQMAAHARAKGEYGVALEADRALMERTTRASEAATLSLRAAQAALKCERVDDALAFLAQAIELLPDHLVLHLELASALESQQNPAGAAAALEASAKVCAAVSEKAKLLYRAALLWQDNVGDTAHARQALEAVAAVDPPYEDVFARLQQIYVAEGARAELAALLERRLEAVTDPVERVEMEVLRGRALADVGDAAAAKGALRSALDANPEHVEALAAFGDVCAAEQDWEGAEDAWIRLARLVSDADRQAAIYFRLGELYDEHLPNSERAELAYQEILKRVPTDTRARERLVSLYQKMGDTSRAIEQQTLLVNAAEAPDIKCRRTTELAAIYEAQGDLKKAEATLLSARKTWPKDDVALASLARFHLRNNQAQAATVLLDRAVADARRALGTGRFEPYLFSTVAVVAELKNRPDAARIAKAAVAALDGTKALLEGAGVAGGDPTLDDLLAPEVLTPAFRDLLKRTGSLLDTAVPFDLTAVRATALPPQLVELGELIRGLAAGYGFANVNIHVSNVLGAVCVPVSTHPPTLVLGQPLVSSNREDVRMFLIHRALKVLQANAAAISRTAPIDLWPLLAAYLKAYQTAWVPPSVDQAKLTDAYGRVTRAMPKEPDPQLATLAMEVIGSIGNRGGTLNTVVNGWGNRAGLLATGDLDVAITGIAWAGGHTNQPPAGGKERVTWINRNAEARELVVFSVSDAYADARSKLGLSELEEETKS